VTTDFKNKLNRICRSRPYEGSAFRAAIGAPAEPEVKRIKKITVDTPIAVKDLAANFFL